jgi:protein-ribulosamine 3-kinase
LKEITKQKIESIIDSEIISSKPVSGGCINNAEIIKTSSGNSFFVKTNYDSEKDMFIKEADGLSELSKANAIRIPKVIYADYDFIIIENIIAAAKNKLFWEDFGRNFAKLHKFTSNAFGFYEDNYIGSTSQINIAGEKESIDWTEFYFNKRLLFQFKLAEKKGYAGDELRKYFSGLENKINIILKDCDVKPSLLHGDLWSGNFIIDDTGNSCLIDPAVYYGHREADLAMTKLFGGFDSRFYSAYDEEYPLDNEYQYRENVYKLYHVLNHLNLFGSGYYNQAVSLIKFYL